MNDLKKEMIKQEYCEAWNHYRHMEIDRSRYLGFLFTFLIASIAFLLNTFSKLDMSKELPIWLFLMVYFLLSIINLLSIFIYTNIKKLSFALTHYDKVIERIRVDVFSKNDLKKFKLDVGKSHPIMNSKLFSNKILSEILCLLICIVLDVVQIKILGLTWENTLHYIAMFMLVVIVFLLVAQFSVFVSARNYSLMKKD